jgi:hypothetical protein
MEYHLYAGCILLKTKYGSIFSMPGYTVAESLEKAKERLYLHSVAKYPEYDGCDYKVRLVKVDMTKVYNLINRKEMAEIND